MLNLKNRVKFVGFCDNPWQWYNGADAFLLSSRWEGMPNSVLESLACGTMVIATEESGGIKEIVDDKVDSVIVAANPQEFIYSMNNVNIKNNKTLLKSLLPEKYKKENVVHVLESWLDIS